MSNLNKEGTSIATFYTSDRYQAADPTTTNTGDKADEMTNQKNELKSPTTDDALLTKEGNETKGKESSLPEKNLQGNLKGVESAGAVDERYVNPAWEKYISSPEQQRGI
jgi:hypothetical protein